MGLGPGKLGRPDQLQISEGAAVKFDKHGEKGLLHFLAADGRFGVASVAMNQEAQDALNEIVARRIQRIPHVGPDTDAARRTFMAIYPTREQIEDLMKDPADQPVVMINLLRFKPRADASEGDASGQEAYGRYAEQMRKVVESQGGRFIWAGRVDSMVIGEEDPGFHVAALVEYPSRQKFLEIVGSDRVREIGEHRAAGLESQWLLAATETSLLGEDGQSWSFRRASA